MSANEDYVSKRVIGCAIALSNHSGVGFLEDVYENALAFELRENRVAFEQQKSMDVFYREAIVGLYVVDFVVADCLILEIKALSAITSNHEAQLMNYLQATGITVSLLLNFGTARLGVRRRVKSHDDARPI